ncbi:hypothetical protein B5X24_HaOG210976 [Helicoverpa armigera]|nr:hypothetical protein B5X24_HaOG210976 [Helicoverpa armigera]
MPKKAPKNAFFYFMLNYKDEQQKKGINYGSLADVSVAAGEVWKTVNPQERARWEAKAKQERTKQNMPVIKYTSTGVPLTHIEQQQKEIQEAIQNEIDDIRNMVKIKAFNQSIQDEDFYLIDVNYYCKAGNTYVIGESTVLRFNLRLGYQDFYHELINPGRIPVGYASDVKHGSTELGLDMPDETENQSNYIEILANIIDYLKQKDKNLKVLPPLYTMPEKVLAVQDFILQMSKKAREDEHIFRIYKLDTLFFYLINSIKSNKNEGFPKESLALIQLKKDPFKYTPGLGCEHHEANEKSMECTSSRTQRWAYTIMDSCCPVVGIDIQPGQHVPKEYDVDGILKYRDAKKVWSGPTVAGFNDASSSCNSTVNDSFEAPPSLLEYVGRTKRLEARVHAPQRIPDVNFAQPLLPPELTEEAFPALSVSHGRGRGMAGRRNIRK